MLYLHVELPRRKKADLCVSNSKCKAVLAVRELQNVVFVSSSQWFLFVKLVQEGAILMESDVICKKDGKNQLWKLSCKRQSFTKVFYLIVPNDSCF